MDSWKKKTLIGAATLVVVLLIVGGIWLMNRMATERFLSDFNGMNGHYKQALFLTGQGSREQAKAEYASFVVSLDSFRQTYATSRPQALRDDAKFNDDLAEVARVATGAKELVETGNLSVAHTTLEGVRPLFNELLRRNGLSLLSVALVDFHDQMEKVLDAANAKNAAETIAEYAIADEKLKAVEAELDDDGVKDIRQNLDATKRFAEQGDVEALPAQATKLKASYVKVYLAKG